MKRNYQKTCDKINKLLDEKKEGFIDEVNKIMEKEVFQKGGEHYFDRELFIKCGCDDEKVRQLVRESNAVMFVPTEDPEEHPGIVLALKPLYESIVNIRWIEYKKEFNKASAEELMDVSDYILIKWKYKGVGNENISLLSFHVDSSGGKVGLFNGHLYYEYFNYIDIVEVCPLNINSEKTDC